MMLVLTIANDRTTLHMIYHHQESEEEDDEEEEQSEDEEEEEEEEGNIYLYYQYEIFINRTMFSAIRILTISINYE